MSETWKRELSATIREARVDDLTFTCLREGYQKRESPII